jgi:hypothetical protein
MNGEQPANTAGTGKLSPLRWSIALLVIAAAAFIGWQAIKVPRDSGLQDALTGLLLGLPTEAQDEHRIGKIILDNHREYRGTARNWSAAYFGSLFLSAACAALAGLVIKLEFFLKNEGLKKDLAALLAILSALLITLSTAGGFHQKWSANRLAAAKVERLGYAFISADRKASLEAFSSQIQAISFERNEEIVSSDSERNKMTSPNNAEMPKKP